MHNSKGIFTTQIAGENDIKMNLCLIFYNTYADYYTFGGHLTDVIQIDLVFAEISSIF